MDWLIYDGTSVMKELMRNDEKLNAVLNSLLFFITLVPFCVVGRKFRSFDHNAALCDVATTVLQELGVPLPEEMTGKQLLDLSS